jgi:hypothetical protein
MIIEGVNFSTRLAEAVSIYWEISQPVHKNAKVCTKQLCPSITAICLGVILGHNYSVKKKHTSQNEHTYILYGNLHRLNKITGSSTAKYSTHPRLLKKSTYHVY